MFLRYLSMYLNTSKVTCCFAIASTVFSYICTLWIPIPQNMANASTKFSSFLVKGRFSNLLTNWNTPNTLLGLLEYIMGMHKMVLCLNPLSISTSGSNLLFLEEKKQLTKNTIYLFKKKVQMNSHWRPASNNLMKYDCQKGYHKSQQWADARNDRKHNKKDAKAKNFHIKENG